MQAGYSLLHSPNPYRIYQLANSSITVNMMSNGQIQFIVSIGVGDPVNWRVYINAKKDHNQGNYGGDYPYAVETVTGSQNSTFYKTANSGLYWPDEYSAVLALAGIGEVDFAPFTVGGGGGCQPTQGQKYCNNDKTRCQWNQSKCNYDCFGCSSGQKCSNGDCVTACQPLEGVLKYCGSDGKTRWVWNPTTCKYDMFTCPSGQVCQNGDCVGGSCSELTIGMQIRPAPPMEKCPTSINAGNMVNVYIQASGGTPPYRYYFDEDIGTGWTTIFGPSTDTNNTEITLELTPPIGSSGTRRYQARVTDSCSPYAKEGTSTQCSIQIIPQGGHKYECSGGVCVQNDNCTSKCYAESTCNNQCAAGSAGYNCINNTCTYVTSGASYGTLTACQAVCGGTQPTSLKCRDDQIIKDEKCQCQDGYIEIPGLNCQKKNTVYMVAAGVVGLMFLTKK